jgi:hypothetical protein
MRFFLPVQQLFQPPEWGERRELVLRFMKV